MMHDAIQSLSQSKEELIVELGMGSLPPQQQETLLEQFAGHLFSRLISIVGEKLPADARPEFERLAEEGNESALQELIMNRIENAEQILKAETRKAIDAYKQYAVEAMKEEVAANT